MTTTDTRPPEVAAAEAEAREAGELLAALEEKVRDGDDKVTPAQLAEQRELSRFAKLRAEAARRKAAKAKEDARLRELRALADEIRGADPDRQQLGDAVDRLENALRDVVALAEGHNQQLARWRARAAQLGVRSGSAGNGLTVRPGSGFTVDDTVLDAVPTGSLLSALVHRATTEHRNVRHEGQPLAVRCSDWRDTNRRPVDLRKALPATAKGGA
ncbi:hypothetical protein [Streptomyces mangrovi]|uniref:hypothetical protein n=1 Tax=Streptomyces mangrovi TaxID=1206892 RepID=UPI00399CB9FD